MERWWDSPDAASNLALVDGSNPQMGMSIAVLGFHALTKAKLSDLETRTLVDRSQLERAYDEADLAPVRQAIVAATSGDMGGVAAQAYADSVVADWRARSKEASGRLATTLVAKGLPWPRAVSRTANVAGVPLERLGRYATTASQPGLDPLSASDAADRVLMEYAHQRGLMEAPASVVISKERERERIRQQEVKNPAFEQEVERNELGQFARESGGEAQKEAEARKAKRAERRATREKWNQRRTQRAAQAQRATETAQPEASRDTSQEATREVSQEATREKGGEATRERGGEAMRENTGGSGYETLSTRVALRDGIKSPAFVDEPLYAVWLTYGKAVVFGNHEGVLPVLFRGTEATKLAQHIRRVQPNTGVTLMEFPQGEILLSDSVGYKRIPPNTAAGVADYKTKGFRPAEYSKIEDLLQDFVPNDKPPKPTGPHAHMASAKVQMVRKADEGRERMRQRQRIKNPVFEREVKRDGLGQSAGEGEDTAEAQKMREERRAKRQERRAKREKWNERRNQRAAQAQKVTQGEATRETVQEATREKSTEAKREVAQEAKREESRTVKRERRETEATRERSRESTDVKSADVWNFVDFVKWGSAGEETFTRFVPGSTMEAVGFAYRDTRGTPDPGREIRVPTFYDQLRDGLLLPVDDVISDAIRQGAKFVSDAQNENTYRYMEHTKPGTIEHEVKVKTEDDLMYVAMVHELAERLTVPMEGAKALPSYDRSRDYDRHLQGPVPQMAASLSNLMMKAMTKEFSLMGKRASTGYASVLSTGQGGHYKEAASTNEIGLHQVALMEPTDSGAPRLLASKRFKSYPGYESGRGAIPYANEHSYISVVKPSTQYLMYVIANATRPDNSELAQKQRANAIKVLRDAYEPQARGGKALNLKGLVQEALKQSKVSVEMLDEQTKYGMAERTLRKPGAHAVRLDNIDILRFS